MKDLKNQSNLPSTVATEWADITLQTIRGGFRNSPTYSSRSLGYMGLCLYECAVYADTTRRSLAGQLNGLAALPLPEVGKDHYWPIAVVSGQETLLKLMYPKGSLISEASFQNINNRAAQIYARETVGVPADVIERSIAFGRSVANAIYAWSLTDGGHHGFSRHFDPTYIFPTGAGYWTPPAVGQTVSSFPLHPTWGNNRTFVASNASLPVPPIMPYNASNTSAYYSMFQDVYIKNNNLTIEEKNIAAWWTDDPTETFSPPGHSYNIATICVKKNGGSLADAGECYARVGMATADAFIHVWKTKYTYHSERPSGFIRMYIDPNWLPYWPEPPFPAFPSGHATQGAAMATALEGVFGNSFAFTDNTHEGARRFSTELSFASRSYSSLWEAAEESAYSRFLGGIHTVQDNEVGLLEGKKIGAAIDALQWFK